MLGCPGWCGGTGCFSVERHRLKERREIVSIDRSAIRTYREEGEKAETYQLCDMIEVLSPVTTRQTHVSMFSRMLFSIAQTGQDNNLLGKQR